MKLDSKFFKRDASIVAEELIGKLLVRKCLDGIKKYRITEIEIYKGEEDSASHARFGKTNRNYVMYKNGGYIYIYMCYGLHYMLNIVTGLENEPQAILIRGIEGFNGPAKLTKELIIDKKFNDTFIDNSEDLWFEDDGYKAKYKKEKRIGIEYAKEPYKSKKWRYILR